MKYPKPQSGMVLNYRYLWRTEAEQGKVEGLKDRPCALILANQNTEGKTTVTVCPVTHSQPYNVDEAVEIPRLTKKRLGLDGERSWVIVNEVNQFTWPGYDIQPIPHNDECIYGALPPKLFKQIKQCLSRIVRDKKIKFVDRD